VRGRHAAGDIATGYDHRARMPTRQWQPYAITVVVIIAAVAAIQAAMGRVPWCRCGYIKLWHGVVQSSENSQHLTDWYTFSHVIHGLAFYWLLYMAAPHWSAGKRLVMATLVEGAWEVLENTPLVINRYRAATIALDYFGDSIINSVFDVAAMLVGFWIASRAPVWASVALAIGFELFVAAMIRDNLALNIIMLLYPIEAIRQWQGG
jgi:Protein of unknown function (DUF2585)